MIQRKYPGYFQVKLVLESILRNLHRQSCLTPAIVNITIIYSREMISWEDPSRFIWLCFIVFANMTFKQNINVQNLGSCLVKNTVTISKLLSYQRNSKLSSLSVCFSQRCSYWNFEMGQTAFNLATVIQFYQFFIFYQQKICFMTSIQKRQKDHKAVPKQINID